MAKSSRLRVKPLPCPFCGAAPSYSGGRTIKTSTQIGCFNEACPVQPFVHNESGHRIEVAVIDWNDRKLDRRVAKRLAKAGIYSDGDWCDLTVDSKGGHQLGRVELLRGHMRNAARAIEAAQTVIWCLKRRLTPDEIRMVNRLKRASAQMRPLVKALREFEKHRARFAFPNRPDVMRAARNSEPRTRNPERKSCRD